MTPKVMLINGIEYVETQEAVLIANRSESHIRLLARGGKLPCIKILGRWAYDKKQLENLVGIIDNNTEEQSGEVENEEPTAFGGGAELDI